MAELRAALEREGGDREEAESDTPWGIPECGYYHSDWRTCADAHCPSLTTTEGASA